MARSDPTKLESDTLSPTIAGAPAASEISIAVRYPGGRADKMLIPLEATEMAVDVEPDDPYSRDIVICDNADRELGKEVLKNRFTESELVYRMRGDVFHELDLWGMHWSKHLTATKLVLPNVDGVIAVSDRLADKFARKTGVEDAASAGLAKNTSNWPEVNHYRQRLFAVTLTNCNYWKKIAPIAEWASVVDNVLDEVGGHWTVCGDGTHADRLERALNGYDNVHFAGYVDAREQLAKSNLMLHPSLLDGQPNSVLEGMASNLPVITNDFAAFTEFDGPIRIANTKADLRELLEFYTDEHLRQEWGDRGRNYIESHHTPAAIGEQYVRFCQELLA